MSRRTDGAGARGIRATIVASVVGAAVAAGALVPAGAASAAPTPSPTASATAKPSARPSAKPAASPTATPTATPAPTAAPRPVGRALALDVAGTAVLTLPAKDRLRDSTRLRVRSGASGAVDLVATRGKRSVRLADAVRLSRTTTGWQRTVRVGVLDLPRGAWTLRARRADDRAVRSKAVGLAVGSGKAVHVAVRPAARTLYPWKDGVLDRAQIAVVGTDETGAVLPLSGSVRLDAGTKHVTRTLGATGDVSASVTGLPLGTASVLVKAAGPAGKPVTRRTALTLAPTGVGALSVARSSDTLQPVVDGFLDGLVLTTKGAASAGSPAKVGGTLTISSGTTVVQRWTVPDGTPRTFTWNGRVGSTIVPATYTVALTLKGPEGPARTTTRTVLVTKDHLPYVVQDLFGVAAGNQQGLAVHDGTFYVGYDNGDGTSRIETFRSDGTPLATLGPIDIGHAAELSYSTVSGRLYAANGGSTNPTKVWALRTDWDAATLADPSSAIVDTIDLSALGNNGMIAVDDARSQLLVFSGSAPAFTVTPVSLWPSTDASGASSHLVGTPMPISIVGIPQGIEVVGDQIWIYTSLKGRNHLAKHDLPGTLSPTPVPGTSADLMWSGEGEGTATGTWNNQPAFFVGAHDANRIGLLVPVADE